LLIEANPNTQAAFTNMSDPVREQVIKLLAGGQAHVTLEDVVKNFPAKLRGVKPKGAPHTAWELLEHMRIALWDILEFSRDAKHVSPSWPEGYWPKMQKPPSDAAWKKSVAAIRKDLTAMQKLVSNPKTDLNAKIPHGTGQTILREALLVADHNAYHIGQLLLVRRLLGAWHD
jgi:DinB family protein